MRPKRQPDQRSSYGAHPRSLLDIFFFFFSRPPFSSSRFFLVITQMDHGHARRSRATNFMPHYLLDSHPYIYFTFSALLDSTVYIGILSLLAGALSLGCWEENELLLAATFIDGKLWVLSLIALLHAFPCR